MKSSNARNTNQLIFKISLSLLSVIVALLICEALLRFQLHSAENKGHYFWPPHLRAVFKPAPEIMPGITGDSMFVTNSEGIRGDELSADHNYRIMAIGGSTTMCAYLDQSETWSHKLQEQLARNSRGLKVWIGNAGLSGLRARHHHLAMARFPFKEMKIDAVMILVGVNDLSYRLSHDKDFDPKVFDTPEAQSQLFAETFKGSYTEYAEDHFIKKLALWQLLRKMKHLVSTRMSTEHIEDDNGKVYVTWREHRQHPGEIRNEMPDLSSALEEYAVTINKMIDVAHEKSTRLIFMTQPTIWKEGLPKELENLLWLGGVGDFQKESGKPYYSAAALDKGMRAYNDVLLRICRERGVECIDLASMLEKDATVFYDDIHFNESGAQKIGLILSRYMLDHPPFGETHAAK